MAELQREVRVAFYTARAGIAAESLSQAQVALSDSVAHISGARLRAGDISLLEAEQARTEAARAHQSLSSVRESTRIAASDLARVIGMDPLAPLVPRGALDADLDRSPLQTIDVERVPAVRAAVADSGAASALARSAAIGAIPLPTLQSGAEWEDPTEPNAGALAVFGLSLPFRSGIMARERALRPRPAPARQPHGSARLGSPHPNKSWLRAFGCKRAAAGHDWHETPYSLQRGR